MTMLLIYANYITFIEYTRRHQYSTIIKCSNKNTILKYYAQDKVKRQ